MNFIDEENVDRAIPEIKQGHPKVASLWKEKVIRGLSSAQVN
jgi:hypothetical protein